MYKPQTITVRREDVITMVTVYEPIVINVQDYPELNGMDESQMQDYIKRNAYHMSGISYNSLGEDIEYANIEDEKVEDEFIDWTFLNTR